MTPEEIIEQNSIDQVQRIERDLVKDLYVFRFAMARGTRPGARKSAANAAKRILNYLEKEFGE